MEKAKDGTLRPVASSNGEAKNSTAGKKRGRWDQTVEEHFVPAKKQVTATTPTSWEAADVRNFKVIYCLIVHFSHLFFIILFWN